MDILKICRFGALKWVSGPWPTTSISIHGPTLTIMAMIKIEVMVCSCHWFWCSWYWNWVNRKVANFNGKFTSFMTLKLWFMALKLRFLYSFMGFSVFSFQTMKIWHVKKSWDIFMGLLSLHGNFMGFSWFFHGFNTQ